MPRKHFSLILTGFLLSILTSPALAMESKPLTLNVVNIDTSRGGLLHVFVFTQDGFPTRHERAFKTYVGPVTGDTHTLVVSVPTDQSFALKVHHDQDGDYKVTKNWLGILPIEGLGFSSGAKVAFGPPSFDDAHMAYPDTAQVTVPITYP